MALLLVVTVASAATAADMRGLLALAHAWSTLTHLDTSAARRPTLCISGLPPALRASRLTHSVRLRRRHRLTPSLKAGQRNVLFRSPMPITTRIPVPLRPTLPRVQKVGWFRLHASRQWIVHIQSGPSTMQLQRAIASQ